MQVLSKHVQEQVVCVLLLGGCGEFTPAVEGFLRRQRDLEILGVLRPGEDPLAQTECLRPAVVLVDLEAPGRDSLAMIGRLREALPGLGIVVLSLSEDNAHRQAALHAGANALVYKARLVRELMPAIRRTGHPDGPHQGSR